MCAPFSAHCLALGSAAGGFGSLSYLYDKNGNRQSETRNAATMPYFYSLPGSNWLFYKGSESRSKTPPATLNMPV